MPSNADVPGRLHRLTSSRALKLGLLAGGATVWWLLGAGHDQAHADTPDAHPDRPAAAQHADPLGSLTKTLSGTTKALDKTVDHTVHAATKTVDRTVGTVTKTVDKTVHAATKTVDDTVDTVTKTVDDTVDTVAPPAHHATAPLDHGTAVTPSAPASSTAHSGVPTPSHARPHHALTRVRTPSRATLSNLTSDQAFDRGFDRAGSHHPHVNRHTSAMSAGGHGPAPTAPTPAPHEPAGAPAGSTTTGSAQHENAAAYAASRAATHSSTFASSFRRDDAWALLTRANRIKVWPG